MAVGSRLPPPVLSIARMACNSPPGQPSVVNSEISPTASTGDGDSRGRGSFIGRAAGSFLADALYFAGFLASFW